jgi:hypothetical protein
MSNQGSTDRFHKKDALHHACSLAQAMQLNAVETGLLQHCVRFWSNQKVARLIVRLLQLTVSSSISLISVLASATSARKLARCCLASRVWCPCLKALRFFMGAPDPRAPPCMRQRFFPETAGARQAVPRRVFAPQRRLSSIGPVLRAWVIGAMPLSDFFVIVRWFGWNCLAALGLTNIADNRTSA